MIKAVVFDWTGTVVDYGGFAPVRALQDALASFGAAVPQEEIRMSMDLAAERTARGYVHAVLETEHAAEIWETAVGHAVTKTDMDAVAARFEMQIVPVLRDTAVLCPGAAETAAALRTLGLKLGMTANYTDSMIKALAPEAAKAGFVPDCCFTPDSAGGRPRPYPYMIFENMKALGIRSARQVVKVGDTVDDMREGKNAGVTTVAVMEGSAEIGLSPGEFAALAPQMRADACRLAEINFRNAGADFVIRSLHELPALIRALGV